MRRHSSRWQRERGRLGDVSSSPSDELRRLPFPHCVFAVEATLRRIRRCFDFSKAIDSSWRPVRIDGHVFGRRNPPSFPASDITFKIDRDNNNELGVEFCETVDYSGGELGALTPPDRRSGTAKESEKTPSMDHQRNTPFNNSLEELCKKTKFSRKEIQLMYRSFKQDCPNGFVEEDTFRIIFSHFFPYGNVSLYAHYVFKTFDPNKNGTITFKDFLQCLSLMCRGSLQEKLQWAFKLYDINGDGRITKKELMDIVCSVYALMGRKHHTHLEEKALRDHVDKIFSKMDLNKDGVVTLDEFMEICLKDETIAKSLAVFDHVL